MKMHFLSGGRLRMRKSVYLPDADRSEMIELPVSCVLLCHRQGNVLFDTGCHPSVAENPEGRWGGLAKFMVPIMGPGEHVLASLSDLGLGADDIDVVVCSHLHPDHCGCNAFFHRATILIHADELAAARTPAAEKSGYLAADWDHPVNIEAFAEGRDLFADGRIVLIPLPGHTPGMTGALVSLEKSGRFLLASDTVSLKATLDTGVIPKNTWNAPLLAKSLAEVAHLQSGGATVICGHDATQWATLHKGLNGYD
jgi:glyoxylase-like metal-dependent hydrolase (beta-lactamase superfamily II)